MTATLLTLLAPRSGCCLRRGGGRVTGGPADQYDRDECGYAEPRRPRRRRADDAFRDTSETARRRSGSPQRRPRSRPVPTGSRSGRSQECKTAVDGDRGGGVTGRVARVHRKVLEPDHVRTVTVNQERRRPARRPTRSRARRSGNAASRHCLKSAANRPNAAARIGNTTPPAMIDPISDASVRSPDRWCARTRTKPPSSPAIVPFAISTLVTRRPSRIESPATAA